MRTAKVTYLVNGTVGRMTIVGNDSLMVQIYPDGRGIVRTDTKAYLWRQVEHIAVEVDEETPLL